MWQVKVNDVKGNYDMYLLDFVTREGRNAKMQPNTLHYVEEQK